MGAAPPPDVQLVREAVGGDHDAAQRLFRLLRHYRQVLTLRILLGYSAEETAELLGMPSAEAVRVAQFRAIRRLRRVLRFAAA
ncbi:sigma factor-like helix-turn-helix DNA-binding protein [Amycolatopsis heterodermiae]|uniref:sigma factor-like helix-turn-helix DNA-binding protein n=1 Tax=Amycolatopsis heterodermiae TaxID=3110235 RepID=UPI00396A6B7F